MIKIQRVVQFRNAPTAGLLSRLAQDALPPCALLLRRILIAHQRAFGNEGLEGAYADLDALLQDPFKLFALGESEVQREEGSRFRVLQNCFLDTGNEPTSPIRFQNRQHRVTAIVQQLDLIACV